MPFSTYQYARLSSNLIAVTTSVTLFTVPASTQFIIKDINISNNNATAVNIGLLLLNGAALIQNVLVPPQSLLRITGLFVANAGETVAITAGTANAITIIINGQTGQ
jgi:hypothetical protein